MLTDSEKAWLDKREFIHHCKDYYIWAGYWEEGVELEMMQEAAIFEARVAEKLATYATMMVGSDIAAPCLECPCQKAGVCYHGTNKSCQWSFLTTARLQVEEEMNAEV